MAPAHDPMRPLGSTLMLLGAAVGASVAVAMLGGFHVAGMSWIVAVGLAKLTLIASGGLMAAGAMCHRLALRREQRAAALRAGEEETTLLP